jgi:hypothetical protein
MDETGGEAEEKTLHTALCYVFPQEMEALLFYKVQQHRRSALSGLQTAHLIAVACSPSPNGHDHWTVRLLAQKAIFRSWRTQGNRI